MEPAGVDHRAREQHGEREDEKDCRYALTGPARMQPLPNWASIMARAAAWQSASTRIRWLIPLVSRITTMNVLNAINFSSMFSYSRIIYREFKNINVIGPSYECS
jgi:hypothetical protein